MAKYTVIPTDTFSGLQMDAGVLLNKFDPATPAEIDRSKDIICPTTGGFNIKCEPTFSDLGEDVDNCPVNMMELKHLDSWAVTIEFTSLSTSKASIKMAFGCADVDTDGAIVPRRELKQTDFTDVWWVGDRADGGCVAVHLLNALSTSGFSLQSSKNSKGQMACTLTGHVSIDKQDEMPLKVYSIDPSTAA